MPPRKTIDKHSHKSESKAKKLQNQQEQEKEKVSEVEKEFTINTSTKPEDDFESEDDEELIEKINDDEECSEVEDDNLYEYLKCQTHDFILTYTELKNDPVFKREPLTKYTPDHIKKVITNARLKKKRENKERQDWQKQHLSTSLLQKRTQSHKTVESVEKHILKKSKAKSTITDQTSQNFQARFLINHFNQFEDVLQNKVLQFIEDLIISNDEIMTKTQQLMIDQLSADAQSYYRKGDMTSLIALLGSTSATISILINIKIGIDNEDFINEANTLSYTLLPYLSQVEDYGFLKHDQYSLMSRFIKSLTDHICDTQCQVGKGFIISSLKINSSRLQSIIPFKNNKEQLEKALLSLKFTDKVSKFIVSHHQKLLWPQLLDVLHGKTEDVALDLLQILQKISILSDPGDLATKLLAVFRIKRLFVDCLLKVDSISIPLQTLICVLENLNDQDRETIVDILSQNPEDWERFSYKLKQKGDNLEEVYDVSYIKDVYDSMTQQIQNKVDLENIRTISKEMSQEQISYKPCDYQSAIVAIIASQTDQFVIAVSPTGSGKTWIQGLLAKYYCGLQQKVTIIEPYATLKEQTQEKLAMVDYNITVMTIEEYYQYGTDDEVIILDEYDMLIQHYPYMIRDSNISGLWTLKDKKVIAFSASSSIIYEKFINNCINKPKVLKFKSQYELVHGISPIQEPIHVNYKNEEELISKLSIHIERMYKAKPLIIIYDEQQEHDIETMLKEHIYQYYKGVQQEVLDKIKECSTGILMLEKRYCRGIDTRFKIDSQVLIVCEVESYHEQQQMIGRSSRTRGVCESYWFVNGTEKISTLIQNLQRKGINEIDELMRLVRAFEQHSNDSILVSVLKKKGVQKSQIRSLKQLEEIITKKAFSLFIKNVKL